MKDFLGNELSVGDKVVHGSGVSGGLQGPYEILGITAKRVRIGRVTCVPSTHLVKVTA